MNFFHRPRLLAIGVLLAQTGCEESGCFAAPYTWGQPDWSGQTDRGTAIGCVCRCGSEVSCFEDKDGGSCGTIGSYLSTNSSVEVFADDGRYTLTAEQVAELTAACDGVADTGCDTGAE